MDSKASKKMSKDEAKNGIYCSYFVFAGRLTLFLANDVLIPTIDLDPAKNGHIFFLIPPFVPSNMQFFQLVNSFSFKFFPILISYYFHFFLPFDYNPPSSTPARC